MIVDGRKYAFHLLPSGILHERPVCLVGNGTVVHVPTLLQELSSLDEKGVNYKGRVKLSDRAHIVFDFHQQIDAFLEDSAKKVPMLMLRITFLLYCCSPLTTNECRAIKTVQSVPHARVSVRPTGPKSAVLESAWATCVSLIHSPKN